jgi:GntR family transcriptional regulator
MTIQNLVRQGLVEIRRGRGTFVASPKMVQELTELTGFVEDMRVLGRTPTARVLSGEVVPAAPRVAEKLAVPAGTTVVPLVEAEYVLEAAAAEPAAAMALGISVGSPIFLIERTSYTSGHRAVDYERLHYRGDYIRFKTRLAQRRVPRAPKCD